MNSRLRRNIALGVLGAVALILRQFDFPLIPVVPFLKFDFSELSLLVGGWIAGFPGILIVAGIRDTLNFMMTGGQMGIPVGAITAFIASATYFSVYYYYEKRAQSQPFKGLPIVQGLLATLALTVSMMIVNYCFALPMYAKLFNFDVGPMKDYMLYLLIPFNFLKGVIVTVGLYVMKKALGTRFGQ